MEKLCASIVVVSVFCLLSCVTNEPILINPMEKNPTEYTFPFSKELVENAIIKAFSTRYGYRYCDNEVVYFGEEAFTSSGSLLWNPKTVTFETKKTLFFLFHNSCPSKVYFQENGKPYTYSPAELVFHIESFEENLTKVWIEVVKPQVPYRLGWFPFPHGRSWEYKDVPPTTVEEYELLQIIGKTLGVNDMPKIKIPKKIVF